MIFVTVGTHNQGFERLVKAADLLAAESKEPFFIQTGCTKYAPKNSRHKGFLPQKEFEKMCRSASVVVSHGGIGSIITPLKLGRPVIVVPRLKKFNEHTNDHQLQITKELDKQGKVLAVYDIKKLGQIIKRAKKLKISKIEKNTRVMQIINNFIENYENRNSA